MYNESESKRRKELEKEMKNMTKEEKRSSLIAPFWDEKTKVNTNTPFMKKIKKLYNETQKNNK